MSNELQDQIQSTLEACQFFDSTSALLQLEQVADLGLPPDLLKTFLELLASELPQLPQSDRILACLTRFLEASRSPLAWLGLFERDPSALSILLRLFSTSQHLAEILIRDSEAFDLLRLTEGKQILLSRLS
jgi:glutamate-ammonia-ligase adenylyltransferase